MIGRLLGWLRKKILGFGRRFFKLDTETYLQIDQGRASIISEEDVPRHYREEDDDDEDVLPKMDIIDSQQRLRSTRIAQLRQTDPYQVAKHAKSNEYVRYDVLQNPELVNADSRFEAELKLAIAKGDDIQPIIDSNPHVSESDVEGMLETDFMVNWGYTVYGNELASKLNDGDADADADGEPAATDATADADAGAGEATTEGVAGKAAGSINTETGDVDISTDASGTGSMGPATGEAGGGDAGGPGGIGGDIGGDAGGGDVGGGEL